ncbi:acyltransferase family protein [Novosphingobium sp.]|uniref:acyltransferase family protein n=1 Tax=Novosphingobium sp. TaxID=1874826 RepID=UPI0026281E33|nr:acyltransferase family protein [Novosphingobium sp.]
MQHRREIEGLRAVAVLPVVLFHADVPGFGGGFVGVDVFFVISGYLITLAIAEAKAAGTFSFAQFYERRARRLLPALFPVLGVSFALAWAVMIPTDFRRLAQAPAASAVFGANMLFARRTGYFDDDEGYVPLLHLWSLSAEEQFYIAFPLLALAPLPAIGAASYGIYLWHNPLLATLDYVWVDRPPVWLTGGVIALSFPLGFASLALIERPVRAGAVLPSRRGLMLVCGTGLLVALSVGIGGHLRTIVPRSWAISEALGNRPPPQEHVGVRIPPPGQKIDFVVFGDSHARQYFPGLQQRLGSGALLTVPGCMSLPQATNRIEQSDMAEDCAAQADALVKLVMQRQIGTVIWAQRWNRELYTKRGLSPLGPTSGAGWPALRDGITQLRAALPATTRLVITGNVPTASAAGGAEQDGYLRCLSYINATCAHSFPRAQAEGHHINPMLERLAQQLPATHYVDPTQVLCDAQGCALVRQGKAIYADWTHLTEFGADAVVVDQLVPQIAEPREPS